jgi:class 3 adenylate cyclase
MRFEARGRFRVPPEKLWPLIADTDALNRAIGLPEFRLRSEPLPAGGARAIGEHGFGAALLGFIIQLLRLPPGIARSELLLGLLPSFPIVRWEEHPFEWDGRFRYSVLREYFWTPLGLFPLRKIRPIVELTPTDDGGTDVLSAAELEPLNPQGSLLMRLVLGPRACQGVIDQCRAFERFLLGEAEHPFPELMRTPASEAAPEPTSATADSNDRVQPAEAAAGPAALLARGVATDLVENLCRHLDQAPDHEVLKMRPYELADRWGVGRRQTLVAFLHATTAGLVEMTWEVLCPGCRISKASYGSLGEVEGQAHCDFCNVTFDAAIDRQVEVRFSVAQTRRQIADRRFCSGGPMNAPHVLAQTELEPGAERTLFAKLEPGSYRLWSRQIDGAAVIDVVADEAERRLAVDATAKGMSPATARLTPGEVEVALANRTEATALIVLENPGWPDTACTAAEVGTIQEFRDLFSAEALAPGLSLAVQRLAFMFTDLTGSTGLYQTVGQARALRLVHDHFRLLEGAIGSHNGAIVKTIGDAIMAAYPTGADAFAAALAMQQAIRAVDTAGAADPERLLKIGIHEGPCIAVTANGRLDYFGTTVNAASRVEHECRGGQIVLTADAYANPAVQQRIAADGLEVEVSQVTLRGIVEPVTLYRILEAARSSATTMPATINVPPPAALGVSDSP